MLMTVLMHDAKTSLLSKGQQLTTDLFANDLPYADDVLVIDVTSARVEQFMQTIGEAGLQYGLVFNWSKLELMSDRCAGAVAKPDGTHVKETRVMKYLGSLLCNDGRIGSEFGSRIGAAQAEFNKLSRIWSHAAVTRDRKILIFNACVISKPVYSFHAAWLNTAECRRLDAFQAKCL
ncbi:unnamed protein product [Polarella glacialis]|uniref:Reverse transcriptase domain-containing protein n=1 Tax=Polarella glacialis TaxID=89957 RepID=A0A813L7F2_POLGL|nr:unnamed protein product [Polarella glacialis]